MYKNKAEKLLLDIYRAVYKEVGADFNKLLESGETKREGWFNNYYLPMERQVEIVEDILKKSRFSESVKRQVSVSYWLGGSPSSKLPNDE